MSHFFAEPDQQTPGQEVIAAPIGSWRQPEDHRRPPERVRVFACDASDGSPVAGGFDAGPLQMIDLSCLGASAEPFDGRDEVFRRRGQAVVEGMSLAFGSWGATTVGVGDVGLRQPAERSGARGSGVSGAGCRRALCSVSGSMHGAAVGQLGEPR